MKSGTLTPGAVIIVALGCSGDITQPTRTAEPTFEAIVSGVDPGVVSVTLTARNLDAEPIEYELRAPCGVTLSFHMTGGSSESPAWSQLDWLNSQPGGCKWVPHPVMLGPGEARVAVLTVRVEDVLGDSLPDGRYGVAAVIAVAAPTLRLAVVEAGETELLR